MSPLYFVIDFFVIMAACIAAAFIERKYLDRRRPDLLCDSCKEPKRLKRTRDRQWWLCNKCMKLWKEE